MSFFNFHLADFLRFSASIYLTITGEDYDMNLFVAMKKLIENIVSSSFVKLRPYMHFNSNDFMKEVAKNLKLNCDLNLINFKN
jgi:hypothetical protein